jgi:4-hydroxy-3-polyprenylbenzoate decarboxylase
MRPEGPFGDHTGFYTAVENYPVFHLTCGYASTGCDLSDNDRRQTAHGRFLHRRRVSSNSSAGVQDEFSGDCGHNVAARRGVSQSGFCEHPKQYPYQAFKVMHGLWGWDK